MVELSPVTLKVIAEDVASKVLKDVRAEIQQTGTAGVASAGSMDKLSSSLKGVATAATAALILGKVVQFMTEAAREAITAEQANNRLAVALRNVAGATEEDVIRLREYATQLSLVTTFTDDEIVSAEALLATFQFTPAQIEQITPRLLDMASAMQRTGEGTQDLEGLARILGKSLTSEEGVGALSRYVSVSGELATKLEATKDPVVRLNILLQELDSRYAGIAQSSAKTLSGQLSNLQKQWNEMKEEVGTELLPVLLEFGQIILENKDDIKELALGLLELLRESKPVLETISDIVTVLAGFSTASREGKEELDKLTLGVNDFGNAINPLGGVLNFVTGALLDLQETADATKIEPQIDVSRLNQAKDLVTDITDALKELDDRLVGNVQSQTTTRLEILKNVLEQARPGENIAVDDRLQQRLQFDTLEQTQKFLKEQGIAQTGGINQEFGLANVENALAANELKNEQIDLSGKLQEALQEENKLVNEQAAAIRQQSINQATIRETEKLYSEEIMSTVPQLNSLLDTRASIVEREAEATKNLADDSERYLETLRLISSEFGG